MTAPTWVYEWSTIEDKARYIVCAIGSGHAGLYLYRPELLDGWQVKRLMPRCYAALPMPAFTLTEEDLR